MFGSVCTSNTTSCVAGRLNMHWNGRCIRVWLSRHRRDPDGVVSGADLRRARLQRRGGAVARRPGRGGIHPARRRTGRTRRLGSRFRNTPAAGAFPGAVVADRPEPAPRAGRGRRSRGSPWQRGPVIHAWAGGADRRGMRRGKGTAGGNRGHRPPPPRACAAAAGDQAIEAR